MAMWTVSNKRSEDLFAIVSLSGRVETTVETDCTVGDRLQHVSASLHWSPQKHLEVHFCRSFVEFSHKHFLFPFD